MLFQRQGFFLRGQICATSIYHKLFEAKSWFRNVSQNFGSDNSLKVSWRVQDTAYNIKWCYPKVGQLAATLKL